MSFVPVASLVAFPRPSGAGDPSESSDAWSQDWKSKNSVTARLKMVLMILFDFVIR
jgi:hypothetical protein